MSPIWKCKTFAAIALDRLTWPDRVDGHAILIETQLPAQETIIYSVMPYREKREIW
jgi:hypothetical protein